ncbi:MAG: TRAP transporter large permease subunit [Streptosporangiales bacterium]|nr:TRAP transporter large permease subunit [Streptosporangiales bacterium]
MSVVLIALIVGAVLLVLLVLGVPVAFALGLTAVISIALFLTGDEFGYLADLTFESLNSFSLLAIPLFVLMGAIFGQSKASRDLLEAAHAWIGRVRGGLGISSVLSCAAFAALTGSSPATSAAIGRIAIPEMVRRGYPNGVATGAIVAGGTLGILIPPSVTLILYGVATETSVGRLFLAGVGPGLLVTALFCVWIVVALGLSRGRTTPAAATPTGSAGELPAVTEVEAYAWRRRFGLLTKTLPFILLIAGVLFVLYAGVATPSEAAAMGCLFAVVLVAVIYRSVTVRSLLQAALETTRTSTMILMIVAFSAVLGQVLSFLGIPQELAAVVADLEVNKWVIFLAMNLLFLVLGLFIPPVAIILITMPVLFPIITELGFDPVWFGVVMTLNMEMGLITPPVGLNLYVVQGIAPEIPARDVLTGALPYVAVLAVGIVLLVVFPDIVTWLPNQIHGG